ncbi:MAG: undecaprenyldiphospho-muramoylpentapeptide beta-N-acetylglucosaminyltransferase, partial [bacterium]
MRVLIIAGGTGGHIFPGISIGQELAKNKTEILFVGRSQGIETEIIGRYKFDYKGISSSPLPRKLSLALIRSFFNWIRAFWESLSILKQFKPQVIIATGGYVCFPLVLGGWFLRIPVVIHEQNTVPGISNRLSGKLAVKITVTFEESKKYFNSRKVLVTGNPVRTEILSVDRATAVKNLELKGNRQTVFILGGSAGAHSLNTALVEALDFLSEMKDKVQFIHLTGINDYESVKSAYQDKGYAGKVFPFMHDIQDAYRAADLIICRAGATTLAEITALGVPAILVPYPFATADHQRKNAQVLTAEGAGVMILNRGLSGRSLSEEILKLLKDQNKLAAMAANSRKLGRPEAAQEIAGLVYSL